jgi:hypothetical protein
MEGARHHGIQAKRFRDLSRVIYLANTVAKGAASPSKKIGSA